MRRPVKPGDPFWAALVRDAAAWGINARDVVLVMMAESGVDPAALNPDGVASGLNQLRDPKHYAPLTRDEYLALPALEQWEHGAGPYFDGQIRAHPGVSEGGARDLYWLNFVPATYKPGTPDDAIIITPEGSYGNGLSGRAIIDANPALVLPADKANPVIRPAGLRAFLVKSTQGGNAARWAEVLSSIDAAEHGTAVAWTPAPSSPRAAESSLAGPALLVGLLGLVAWRSRRRRA